MLVVSFMKSMYRICSKKVAKVWPGFKTFSWGRVLLMLRPWQYFRHPSWGRRQKSLLNECLPHHLANNFLLNTVRVVSNIHNLNNLFDIKILLYWHWRFLRNQALDFYARFQPICKIDLVPTFCQRLNKVRSLHSKSKHINFIVHDMQYKVETEILISTRAVSRKYDNYMLQYAFHTLPA